MGLASQLHRHLIGLLPRDGYKRCSRADEWNEVMSRTVDDEVKKPRVLFFRWCEFAVKPGCGNLEKLLRCLGCSALSHKHPGKQSPIMLGHVCDDNAVLASLLEHPHSDSSIHGWFEDLLVSAGAAVDPQGCLDCSKRRSNRLAPHAVFYPGPVGGNAVCQTQCAKSRGDDDDGAVCACA